MLLYLSREDGLDVEGCVGWVSSVCRYLVTPTRTWSIHGD
jgi:hypothetical protein